MPAKKKTGSRSRASSSETFTKEFKVTGENLLKKVRELIKEGNVRRLVIRQKNRTLIEVPLNVGAVAVLIAPVLAAVGAIAALVTDCTIVVEKDKR